MCEKLMRIPTAEELRAEADAYGRSLKGDELKLTSTESLALIIMLQLAKEDPGGDKEAHARTAFGYAYAFMSVKDAIFHKGG